MRTLVSRPSTHPHQPMPRPWELKPNTHRMCQPKARRMSRKHTSSSELESAPAWVRCTGQPRDTNAQVTDTKVTSAMPQVAVGRQTLGTHTHTPLRIAALLRCALLAQRRQHCMPDRRPSVIAQRTSFLCTRVVGCEAPRKPWHSSLPSAVSRGADLRNLGAHGSEHNTIPRTHEAQARK